MRCWYLSHNNIQTAESQMNLRFSAVMQGSRIFCQRGSNTDNGFFFFFYFKVEKSRVKYHYARAIISLPRETPFKWLFAGVLMMVQHGMLAW